MSVSKLLLILTILPFYSLISQPKLFNTVNLIDDYKGIIKNGNDIILYGNETINYLSKNFEIIDEKKVSNNDFIMKIINDSTEIFGLTRKSLFRSYYNDSYWIKNNLPNNLTEGIDFVFAHKDLYILTNNAIYKADYEININEYPVISLSTEKYYSQLETDRKNLFFIADSSIFYKYNLYDKSLDSINILEALNLENTKISKMKIYNDDIYLQLQSIGADKEYYFQILKSSDLGKTWIYVSPPLIAAPCFKLLNDKLFFLSSGSISLANLNSSLFFFFTNFFYVDSSHYSIDSTYFTSVTTDSTLERYLVYSKNIFYRDFIQYGDTIIAVGDRKLISYSVDGGN